MKVFSAAASPTTTIATTEVAAFDVEVCLLETLDRKRSTLNTDYDLILVCYRTSRCFLNSLIEYYYCV
jgi:hypothetical protein